MKKERLGSLKKRKRKKSLRLTEFSCLGRHEASIEAFVRSAHSAEMILYNDVVFAADQFPFNEFYVIGLV